MKKDPDPKVSAEAQRASRKIVWLRHQAQVQGADSEGKCKNCGAEIIPDSKYCARCGIGFENIPPPVSEPQETSQLSEPQEKSQKGIIALVAIILIAAVIGGIVLIGNSSNSTGNTDYSSYYNGMYGGGWTIQSPFIKGTDSDGNAAYIGLMRNQTGNYSLSNVIHIFDTESAAKNDYTKHVTHSISQGYTTADLAKSCGSEVGSNRLGTYVWAEWAGGSFSSAPKRIFYGYDDYINKWVVVTYTTTY